MINIASSLTLPNSGRSIPSVIVSSRSLLMGFWINPLCLPALKDSCILDKNLSYTHAVSMVLSENPELKKAYNCELIMLSARENVVFNSENTDNKAACQYPFPQPRY